MTEHYCIWHCQMSGSYWRPVVCIHLTVLADSSSRIMPTGIQTFLHLCNGFIIDTHITVAMAVTTWTKKENKKQPTTLTFLFWISIVVFKCSLYETIINCLVMQEVYCNQLLQSDANRFHLQSKSRPEEQGWRSGESTCLPPMCPGIDSGIQGHDYVGWIFWFSTVL